MIDERVLERISKIFCGDTVGCYSSKNGQSLVNFFNKYFDYNDKYGSGFQTKWRYTKEKIEDLLQKGKIDQFFNVILSIDYIKSEQELTEVEAAKKSSENYTEINKILSLGSYSLIKTDNGYYFSEYSRDLQKIGEGAFAIVYLHTQSGLVVKKLKRDYLEKESIRSRFKREFQITKDLSNISGIISVYDFNIDDYSYTMEKADSTLEEYIHKYSLDEESKIKIINRILEIMSEVHNRNVIHRDLSPNNIFAIKKYIKIADFGLGKNLSCIHSHQTKYSYSLGQYDYCAPEQIRSLKNANKRSDVYSLGKIINFILTSDPNNSHHIFRSIAEKATSRNEEQRYENAIEMYFQVNKIIEQRQRSDYKQKIMEKIYDGIYDESVEDYIYNMDAVTKSKLLLTKQKNFLRTLLNFMIKNEDNAKNVIEDIEQTYEDVCKTFPDYDPFAEFAYNVIKTEPLPPKGGRFNQRLKPPKVG